MSINKLVHDLVIVCRGSWGSESPVTVKEDFAI